MLKNIFGDRESNESGSSGGNDGDDSDVLEIPIFCGKGKAIPLQAWRGPEGSRRLRFPDFKTISTERW